MANHNHSPRPPLATAAAAREEVRLWDRDWTIPVSAHVEVEEGLGLEEGHRTGHTLPQAQPKNRRQKKVEPTKATDGEVTKNDPKEAKAQRVMCGN